MTDEHAQPKVSVLTVNYNAGADLINCVAGVLNQTIQDFEMLIIDNASTDGSIDEIRPRIVVHGEHGYLWLRV
ncbi:MAG: glycosyltransferase, partial [Pseudomonadota bacterium]